MPTHAPTFNVACLLLAAGSSRRMNGANKLLLDDGGASILARTAAAVGTASFSEVIAVTGFDHDNTARELGDLKIIFNPQFERGMHASIRAGLAHLPPGSDFVAICLGDQPALSGADFNYLIEEARLNRHCLLVVPLFEGERGNPTLIASSLIPEILREPDRDQGCRYLFDRYPEKIAFIEMPTPSTLVDVDTREKYDRYRETSAWK